MGNSLTDQLLKAGLANKKQVNKAKHELRQTTKKQRKKNKKAPPVVNDTTLAAQKARAEEAERNRRLNLERREKQKQKELAAQISQMIGSNELSLEKGKLGYNFVDGKKIKKIYVTQSIREQLSNGSAVIVSHQDKYHVLSAESAEKIHQRDPKVQMFKIEPKKSTDGDYDPYEEFPVPDDIDW